MGALDKILDPIWSKEVREYWKGKCPCCSETVAVTAAHIIPRGNRRTRWVVECGILACKNLHDEIDHVNQEKKEEIVNKYYFNIPNHFQNLIKVARGIDLVEAYNYRNLEDEL